VRFGLFAVDGELAVGWRVAVGKKNLHPRSDSARLGSVLDAGPLRAVDGRSSGRDRVATRLSDDRSWRLDVDRTVGASY
jgi:hypothetical protein